MSIDVSLLNNKFHQNISNDSLSYINSYHGGSIHQLFKKALMMYYDDSY